MDRIVFETKHFRQTHIEKSGRKIGIAHDVAVEGRYTRFALLENIWKKLNASVKNNKSIEEFLKKAGEATGISNDIFAYLRSNKKLSDEEKFIISEINDFLRVKEYEEHLKDFKDISKGQEPSLIHASNSEYVDLFEILNGSEYEAKNRVMYGGVFGTSINIRKPEHLTGVADTDFAEIFYMVGHLSHSGNLSNVPYILFVGKYDEQTKDKGEDNFEDVVALIGERKKNFIQLAIKAGNYVEKDVLYCEDRQIPLLSVVYFAHERKFYVITESGTVEFSKYIEENFGGYAVARKHLEALRKHYEDEAYSKISLFKRFSQSLHCVDSREQELTKFYSVAKVMGAIPSDFEIERLARHDYAKRTDIYLHTNCGYLNVAQGIHYLILEIIDKVKKAGSPEKAVIVNAFADVVHGKNVKIDERYADELKLSAESKKLFKAIFNKENLNMQNIMRHMFERGVLRERKVLIRNEIANQVYMPAVEQVEKTLEQHGYKKEELGNEFFSYLVLEEIGREQAHRIEEKTKGKLNFVILIHDIKTGRIYDIPKNSRKWFVENKVRRDAFTGEVLPLPL
ncbi:MAG: hypothetical protein QXL47_02455 [Candidatus Anstonellales archaeon]